MSDFLLDLGQNPQARKLIKSLGLPIPLPEKLRRDNSAWQARPLQDQKIVAGAANNGSLIASVAETITAAGADPYLVDNTLAPIFQQPGETFGRPARIISELDERSRIEGIVFDASGINTADELRAVYDFFHPLVNRINRSGRVIVLGRGGPYDSAAQAAAQSALEGFTRSLAKEIGRSGATANLILVEKGSEKRLPATLRFVLSARSAFVTGQPMILNSKAPGHNEPSFVRPLEKKTVLVTGAARGIGESTARLFAQEGAHVFCLDRPGDEGPLSQLAREISGTALLLDITDDNAAKQIQTAIGERGLDVIVHNAGITRDKTLARMKPELWDQTINVNLASVARVTEALEKTVLKDGGRVICLSSIAGIAGNMGQTNYAASKSGIIGYVRTLSSQLAPRGITVNAIAPGFIETRLTAAIPVAIREVARRMSALGQGGLPEDVGQAIVFLASPGAQGLTGQILRVCGGSLVGA